MKQNEPSRHHYVPQFYQRGFADSDGCLWMYDRNSQRFTKVHPKNICCERELYTIDPNGNKNRYIEVKWLSQVDGDGARAIRQFESGSQITDEWRECFSIYMAQQITRTPANLNLTTRNFQAMREEILRVGFTDVDRARELMTTYGQTPGDGPEGTVTPEDLVKAVVSGHVRPNVDEVPSLTHMVTQIEFLSKWLFILNWEIVSTPGATTGYVICDYPFVLVPPRDNRNATGLGFPGTVMYFPLTRALCMRIGERGYALSYRKAGKEEVRIINQNIAVNSERFVMGPSREQLDYVIGRSNTLKANLAHRTDVDVVARDGDSSIIRFTFWPRRDFFYRETS
jgi:hypothetical protein